MLRVENPFGYNTVITVHIYIYILYTHIYMKVGWMFPLDQLKSSWIDSPVEFPVG